MDVDRIFSSLLLAALAALFLAGRARCDAPALAFAPPGQKPALETLLKPKSIERITEDFDTITNARWDEDDFHFVNATLVRTPFPYARPKVTDWSLYPKMSTAIKKFEYDPRLGLLEMIGESHGLRMHSWVKVEQAYADVIRFTIVRGDMVGFRVNAFLWDRNGKMLTVAEGVLPGAKQMLPTLVSLVFKPVSEIVLSVATKNFRSYIEDEYRKMRK